VFPLRRRPRPNRRVWRSCRPGAREEVLRLTASSLPARSAVWSRRFHLPLVDGPLRSAGNHQGELEQEIRIFVDRDHSPRIGAMLWCVPVCYEGEFAPDLAEARLTGLTPNEVVACTAALGFTFICSVFSRLSVYGTFRKRSLSRGGPTPPARPCRTL
jgi:hypothetical protein